jgi:polyhydroxybutyrate depolymerase
MRVAESARAIRVHRVKSLLGSVTFSSCVLSLAVGLAPACSSSSDANGTPPTGGDASTGSDSGADAQAGDSSSLIDGGADARDAAANDASSIILARPYTLKVPSGYDASKPTPLLVMFHGYSATGAIEESYFRIGDVVDAHGFLYAYGDGTIDSQGKRFWNATDGCCNIDGKSVDDVAYAGAIMDDVASKYNVDPKRIFVIGHSNGGFMVHRLACDLAPRVAAIVSLAGAVWNDPARCNPTSPVSILDVHGDADATISYTGGGNPPYPSEATTMATWAAKNGCTGALAPNGKTLDLDTSLAGAETVEKAYGGCPAGIDVELWTIQGGAHIPTLARPTWADEVWGFLSAHPKK